MSGDEPRREDAPRSPRRSWTPLDLATFLREPPPEPDWLLEGYIEHGEIVWIAGPGKAGKSMVALFLVDVALSGVGQFLGLPTDTLDWVVYVDGENGARSVRRRVHLAGMSIGAAEQINYQSVRGVDLNAAEDLRHLEALVTRPGRGLVILDSLIALHGADEDTAREVRSFVTGIRAVAEAAGVTMIGLAHENRGGNMRGSLDWRNAADTVLELRKDETGLRTLKIGDRRNGPEDLSPRVFRFVPDGDHLRLELTSAATPAPVMSKTEQVGRSALEVLLENPGITRAETARRLGYRPDHYTFKNAYKLANSWLQEGEGGNRPSGAPQNGAGGAAPYTRAARPALPPQNGDRQVLAEDGQGFQVAVERVPRGGDS